MTVHAPNALSDSIRHIDCVSPALAPEVVARFDDVIMPYLKDVQYIAKGDSAENVWQHCLSGEWSFHCVGEHGFCILQWFGDSFHIVTGCAWRGHCKRPFEEVFKLVLEFAKEKGMSFVTFYSHRIGMQKMAEKFNAKREGFEYEVTVDGHV